MRKNLIAAVAATLSLLFIPGARAQTVPQTPTPTTKILAIGTINEGVDPAKAQAILPTEVQETVKLYLGGRIDQWYSMQDRRGVAFILNMTNVDEAHQLLEQLPLGRAHLMSFELIRLGPLNPLRRLLTDKSPTN